MVNETLAFVSGRDIPVSVGSDGYFSGVDCIYGYYLLFNPNNLKLAFLVKGIQPPKVKAACELGVDQAVSINVHAAGSNVAWHGSDFNPAQTGFAQKPIAATGANAQIADEAFADFLGAEPRVYENARFRLKGARGRSMGTRGRQD